MNTPSAASRNYTNCALIAHGPRRRLRSPRSAARWGVPSFVVIALFRFLRDMCSPRSSSSSFVFDFVLSLETSFSVAAVCVRDVEEYYLYSQNLGVQVLAYDLAKRIMLPLEALNHDFFKLHIATPWRSHGLLSSASPRTAARRHGQPPVGPLARC